MKVDGAEVGQGDIEGGAHNGKSQSSVSRRLSVWISPSEAVRAVSPEIFNYKTARTLSIWGWGVRVSIL